MSKKKKLILRVKGGLGNQLFTYAAGKRLATINSAEFIIDDITGFANDVIYKRTFQLNNFNIKFRPATPPERLEPLKEFRDKVLFFISRKRSFGRRKFIFQEKTSYDERLLNVRFTGTRFLEGYWQSEKYFKDIESIVRDELTLKEDLDEVNQNILDQISSSNSVAIHFRWFDELGSSEANNTDRNYYTKAIEFVRSKNKDLHFFIFSDNVEAVKKVLPLSKEEFTIIDHNKSQDDAYKDLWLMSKCNSIIIANSSFSWWAAWLGDASDNLIICPKKSIDHENRITSWNFEGQLPDRWIKL